MRGKEGWVKSSEFELPLGKTGCKVHFSFVGSSVDGCSPVVLYQFVHGVKLALPNSQPAIGKVLDIEMFDSLRSFHRDGVIARLEARGKEEGNGWSCGIQQAQDPSF